MQEGKLDYLKYIKPVVSPLCASWVNFKESSKDSVSEVYILASLSSQANSLSRLTPEHIHFSPSPSLFLSPTIDLAAPSSLLPSVPAHTHAHPARWHTSVPRLSRFPPFLATQPSLQGVLTCPPPREARGASSRLCADTAAPPGLPASRDAGVLPCSGQ